MEQAQQKQLQWNEPKQDQQAFLLKSGIDNKIEPQFVGKPQTGGQLDRIHHQQQPGPNRRGIFKDVDFHKVENRDYETTGLRDHGTTGPQDYGTTGPRTTGLWDRGLLGCMAMRDYTK